MDMIRVLVADDHLLFRDGVRALLTATPETECVGEATTGTEATAMTIELQPDVVLMDVQMPDGNGVDATRQIVQMSPHIGVLMVTMFEDDQLVFAAMQAGARGYVLKGANHTDLLRAIHAVNSGEAIFSPGIAARLMSYFTVMQPRIPREAFPELSEREREILTLIAQGMSNTAIAEHLVVSLKTVRNHVTNILSKLQVADRTEALLRARDAGLGG